MKGTNCNNADGKTINYLDRHEVECSAKERITEFRFTNHEANSGVGRCDGRFFQYVYTCTEDSGAEGEEMEVEGGCQDWRVRQNHAQGGTDEWLDRHHPFCGDGYALKEFHFARGNCGSSEMRYKWLCAPVTMPRPSPKRVLNTGCHQLRHEKLQYLDRQKVQCGDQLLQGFRVTQTTEDGVTCGGNDMTITYHCI